MHWGMFTRNLVGTKGTLLFGLLLLMSCPQAFADELRCLPKNLRDEKGLYKTVSMDKSYIRDDAMNNTLYLKPEEREFTRAPIADGKIKNRNGRPQNVKLQMYVMDPSGEFYVLPDEGHYQHSTFFAGAPIAMAGILTIKNGQLLHIDNGSGHYKPSAEQLLEALDSLYRQGIDISVATLGFLQRKVTKFRIVDEQEITALQYLFKDPASLQCLAEVVKNPKESSARAFQTLEKVDEGKFANAITELERSGQISEFSPALRELLKRDPKLERFFSLEALAQVRGAAPVKACNGWFQRLFNASSFAQAH